MIEHNFTHFKICPVKTEGGNGNSVVLWCGGDEVFAVERRVPIGTLTFQRLSQCGKTETYLEGDAKSPLYRGMRR